MSIEAPSPEAPEENIESLTQQLQDLEEDYREAAPVDSERAEEIRSSIREKAEMVLERSEEDEERQKALKAVDTAKINRSTLNDFLRQEELEGHDPGTDDMDPNMEEDDEEE